MGVGVCVGVGKCSESWTRPWVQDDGVTGQSCFGLESFYSTYPPFKALDNSMNLTGTKASPCPGARGINLFAH